MFRCRLEEFASPDASVGIAMTGFHIFDLGYVTRILMKKTCHDECSEVIFINLLVCLLETPSLARASIPFGALIPFCTINYSLFTIN